MSYAGENHRLGLATHRPPPGPEPAPQAPAAALNPVGTSARRDAPDSTVSALVVRGLLQAVEQAGVPRADFLRVGRLDVNMLDRFEVRVPRAEVLQLCEVALDLSGDPAFGLHWAENLTERMFGSVSHLLVHSASLRQALEMLAQFFRLVSDEAEYSIVEQSDTVTISCRAPAGSSARVQRFVAEVTLGGFWQLVRCFDSKARPTRVCFEHAAPPYHAEYARLFAGTHCFGQAHTGLVFARSLMNANALASDQGVHAALVALADERLQRISDGAPYAQRVREHLLRDGGRDRASMEVTARALQTSERSLRRRLAEEGTSYAELVDEAFSTLAKALLSKTRHSLQEVAYAMGFSNATTFHRAFKRWTGTTPAAYREQSQS